MNLNLPLQHLEGSCAHTAITSGGKIRGLLGDIGHAALTLFVEVLGLPERQSEPFGGFAEAA